MLDFAYEVISQAEALPISFKELWEKVFKKAGLTKEEAKHQISRFYTNLSLDGRFVALTDNFWDLRSNHTFDKVHIDMNDVYTDVETSGEEDEEEAEYLEILDEEKPEKDVPEDEEETEEKETIEELF